MSARSGSESVDERSSGAAVLREYGDRGLAILIPVYEAAPALRRCLESLGRHTDLTRHRLALLPDGPQSEEMEALFRDAATRLPVRIAPSPERRGFAAAVNRGAALFPGLDLLLLNSDTQVAGGWLERILDTAVSAERVATVTPFTNFGSICSLPRPLVENRLPLGHDVDSMAALVERHSPRLRPRLPTAVGFCCFVARRAFDEAGGFDPGTFGLGYGEEVDFCLRASAAGWIHLLDDATFVFHEGQRSFRSSGVRRSRAAQGTLRRRHPEFRRQVAEFLRVDPLAASRAPIVGALVPSRSGRTPQRPPVLHVVHGWPPWNQAGTEKYAERLVRWQAPSREVTVLARIDEPDRETGQAIERLEQGARVRLLVNHFDQRDPRARNAFRIPRFERELEGLLREARPFLAHLHHLAGLGLSLAPLLARHGVPVVWQLQDWWGLCARTNLFDAGWKLCSGPTPRRCSRCLPLTALPGARFANPVLYRLRRRHARRALATAAAFVAGSDEVVESYRRARLLPAATPVHVLDYGIGEVPPRAASRRPASPIRFGFIGSLLPHKGLHLAAEALRERNADEASLTVWGDTTRSPEYVGEVRRRAGAADVRWMGNFDEAASDAVWSAIDVLLVPSLGLESYGLVVEEAIARGVPVVASSRGALPGRLREGGGLLFDPDEAGALARRIGELIADPAELAALAPRRAVRGIAEHGAEIDAVYDEVLARRGRS